ncbi:MAG: GNAT family N-acetyltransferase [Cohaesibacter sp.]|jgi:CelD/BcsL family acetyltransferase involved in cellulose biosynthesis|nr:GNAT family N-acetyltransferase [Cohaesibacter sp.]
MLASPGQDPLSSFMISGMEIRIFDNLDYCEQDWLRLEETAIGPTYQRYGWQQAWFSSFANDGKITPHIVIGYEGGKPAFLLPFVISQDFFLSVLRWSGGKHSNFNFGLFTPSLLQKLTDTEAHSLFGKRLFGILEQSGADLINLEANPMLWDRHWHIFGSLAQHMGMTPAFGLDLSNGFDAVYSDKSRKRMRKKQRWQHRFLENEGLEWRVIETTDPAQYGLLLSAFYHQKQSRFQKLGIKDVFGEKETQDFITALGTHHLDGPAALHFYGLEVGGNIIATYAGGSHNGCFSAYFNSFDEDYLPRLSAGELLLGEMIRHRATLGDRFFDLGMGDERYKHIWCDTRIDYYTIHRPLTHLGTLGAAATKYLAIVKRTIRSNPALWNAFKVIRKIKAKL